MFMQSEAFHISGKDQKSNDLFIRLLNTLCIKCCVNSLYREFKLVA